MYMYIHVHLCILAFSRHTNDETLHYIVQIDMSILIMHNTCIHTCTLHQHIIICRSMQD